MKRIFAILSLIIVISSAGAGKLIHISFSNSISMINQLAADKHDDNSDFLNNYLSKDINNNYLLNNNLNSDIMAPFNYTDGVNNKKLDYNDSITKIFYDNNNLSLFLTNNNLIVPVSNHINVHNHELPERFYWIHLNKNHKKTNLFFSKNATFILKLKLISQMNLIKNYLINKIIFWNI